MNAGVGPVRVWATRIRGWLPQGSTLGAEARSQRHRTILALLWLHVPALLIWSLIKPGDDLLHAVLEVGTVVAIAMAATLLRRHGDLSAVLTTIGLLTCSAAFVHLSGGLIELHFHYFVIVAIIALYQEWAPFLVAMGYVVLQHGVQGADLFHGAVYNHAAALDSPWVWAGIHGVFITAMSIVGLISWRLNESLISVVGDQKAKLDEAQAVAHVGSYEWIIATGELSWTDQMYRLLGEERDRFISTFDAFMARVHPEDHSKLEAALDRSVQDQSPFALDFRIIQRGGRILWIHGRGRITFGPDRSMVGMTGTCQDITVRKELEDQLSHQAFHDALTGLANQALFRDRVAHAVGRLARHPGQHLAVLFIDLDNFKAINDTGGHAAGDDLLVAVADRIRGCVRAMDTAARLGGDEFAVLVEDLEDRGDVDVLAARLIDVIRQPYVVAGREVVVGASIGVAHHDHGVTKGQLLRNADIAMYAAKSLGKGRYAIFQQEMYTAAVERIDMERDLRAALDRHQLTLHYQPVVSLTTGSIEAVEALVRWEHAEKGFLPPSTFIPLAEETGLIRELGRQVLMEACLQARQWQDQRPGSAPLTASVNLSPRQVQGEGMIEDVREALAISGLPATSLMLEITEGAMLQDTDATLAKLNALRSLGVRLALDDFGTGYSSLSYLQRFPVDVLKIDRSFINAIETDSEKSCLVGGIISLAHSLRLHVVAEGVETSRQAEILTELGCETAQGYYLARPMAADALGRMLEAPALILP